ncbi:MAG TPA: tyrosine-protein phosphatase, partial [Comamonas denitrificans]|nr:tyrosine-protein phosphatase [Comamonas denitrificans]
AGKDRTGWAAALLLHALGVPQQVIAQDYLLTNQLYRRPAALAAQAAQHIPPEVLHVLWTVQPAFLDSAYAAVAQHWGSIHAYLHEALGLGPSALAQLRGRYLQALA